MTKEPADFVVETPGGRLDAYLAARIKDRSRNSVQIMIRNQQVRVNGEVVAKPAFELQSGDTIQLSQVDEKTIRVEFEVVELDILHETEDYIVINKSHGIVVHPSPGHESGTLAQAAIDYAPELHGVGDPGREGLVHRLDKDTSGLIIFAKNEATLKLLQQQFKSREIEKTYLALADGAPPSDKGRVEAPIGRDPEHRQRFGIQDGGRQAITEFRTRERFKHHTLLEVHPITGRTHQRIHLKFLDCPVVGDKVYGMRNPSLDVKRQMLHAWKMKLPGHEEFEAPIPEDLSAAIQMATTK
jgi:23S rRNA pseudouridine1911/1915/1917 synthase